MEKEVNSGVKEQHSSGSAPAVSLAAAFVLICAGLIIAAWLTGRSPVTTYRLGKDAAFSLTNLDDTVQTIRSAMENRSAAIHVSVKLKGEYMDDITPFVNELMSLVYLPADDPKGGDYLRFQTGGYTFGYGHEKTAGGYIYNITITPEYYSDRREEELTDEAVSQILEEIDPGEGAAEYDRVRAVYDYLCENVRYDLIHRNNSFYHLKSTAYGALVNHAATCQGYCNAMYRLLKEMGVDCRIIIGEGITEEGNEIHSWIIVRIADYYYNVDPAWNSNYTEKDYFLKSDPDFPDHIRADEYNTEAFLSEYPMAADSY